MDRPEPCKSMTTYILKANDEQLVAESLGELADVLNAAVDAGHVVTEAIAVEDGEQRALGEAEFRYLLLAASQRRTGRSAGDPDRRIAERLAQQRVAHLGEWSLLPPHQRKQFVEKARQDLAECRPLLEAASERGPTELELEELKDVLPKSRADYLP